MGKLVSKKSLIFFWAPLEKFPGNSLMEPGSDTYGCIRQFPGNFLMHPPWDDKLKIGSSQILQIQLKRECIRKFLGNFLIHPSFRGMDVLVLKGGPWVKLMPDLDIFVGAMMGKKIVLELPGPCRGDLRGFSTNLELNLVKVRDLGLTLWENDAARTF